MTWLTVIFAAFAGGMFVLYLFECWETHEALDERDAARKQVAELKAAAALPDAKVLAFPLSRARR